MLLLLTKHRETKNSLTDGQAVRNVLAAGPRCIHTPFPPDEFLNLINFGRMLDLDFRMGRRPRILIMARPPVPNARDWMWKTLPRPQPATVELS